MIREIYFRTHYNISHFTCLGYMLSADLFSCFSLFYFLYCRVIMQMLYHAIMKFCVLTLWQQMGLSTGETRTRRLVGSMKQFRTIHALLSFGQPWLKLMQIWLQLTRTGIHDFQVLCAQLRRTRSSIHAYKSYIFQFSNLDNL